MKTETLDSLLLDHALRELRPEVVELLEAYLAQNPGVAARAAQLDQTAAFARRAVTPPSVPLLQKPELARWQAAARSRWPDFAQWKWLPLAACLALGAFGGWAAAMNQTMRSDPMARGRPAAVASVVAQPMDGGAEPGAGAPFWSLAPRLDGRTPPVAAQGSRYRLIWESPLKKPTLEENP